MDIRDFLIEQVKEITEGRVTEINDNDTLTAGLGFSSMDIITVIGKIEDEYDLEFTDDSKLNELQTFKDVVDFIESELDKKEKAQKEAPLDKKAQRKKEKQEKKAQKEKEKQEKKAQKHKK